MPKLSVYSQPEFPAVFKMQAIAFMRMEWPSIFQGENLYMPETYPPDSEPVHFVVAEDDTLISYAAIARINLLHGDLEFRTYGFGNMLTFPPFRSQGWGSKVLTAATQFIEQSDVDIAALFCDPSLERFYARSRWIVTHSPTRLGQPVKFEEYVPSRMMIFVSEKGKSNQSLFETQPMYIEWPW